MFFFFNDTATTEIYTLSLHDALPIYHGGVFARPLSQNGDALRHPCAARGGCRRDRKSTRLNSSHLVISYAVFCLKKKNKININIYSTNPTRGVYTCIHVNPMEKAPLI